MNDTKLLLEALRLAEEGAELTDEHKDQLGAIRREVTCRLKPEGGETFRHSLGGYLIGSVFFGESDYRKREIDGFQCIQWLLQRTEENAVTLWSRDTLGRHGLLFWEMQMTKRTGRMSRLRIRISQAKDSFTTKSNLRRACFADLMNSMNCQSPLIGTARSCSSRGSFVLIVTGARLSLSMTRQKGRERMFRRRSRQQFRFSFGRLKPLTLGYIFRTRSKQDMSASTRALGIGIIK